MKSETRKIAADCRLSAFVLSVLHDQGEFPCDGCLVDRNKCGSVYGPKCTSGCRLKSICIKIDQFELQHDFTKATISIEVDGETLHIDRCFRIQDHISVLRHHFNWMIRAAEKAMMEKIR